MARAAAKPIIPQKSDNSTCIVDEWITRVSPHPEARHAAMPTAIATHILKFKKEGMRFTRCLTNSATAKARNTVACAPAYAPATPSPQSGHQRMAL